MRFKLLLFFAALTYVTTHAQINFQEQIISTDADHANDVFAVDIDGDGDMDVLSASENDDKIAWYENTDGLGTFDSPNIIDWDADHARSVHATDIDGDGDMDVLSASENNHKVAWYENTDGQGNFGSPQIITSNADHANMVYAADLDGDGDMDVLSASENDDKIAWYENLDGLGNFGNQQIISQNTEDARAVYAADLDGDGDMDVLSASEDDNKIAWFENTDGLGTFGDLQCISTMAHDAQGVFAADLDGDGDMDVLSASEDDNKIAWYENMDGLGSFGDQLIISSNTDHARDVHAVDLDGDGDMDVLSASENDDKIAWYENTDGLGNFGDQLLISNNADHAMSVYAADINGDGNMDVLSASENDDKIAWYEHSGLLAIQQNELDRFLVYPVPTEGLLYVRSITSIAQIEIYNSLGQLVRSNRSQNKIDISHLNQGLYFIKIEDENGSSGLKKLWKK